MVFNYSYIVFSLYCVVWIEFRFLLRFLFDVVLFSEEALRLDDLSCRVYNIWL